MSFSTWASTQVITHCVIQCLHTYCHSRFRVEAKNTIPKHSMPVLEQCIHRMQEKHTVKSTCRKAWPCHWLRDDFAMWDLRSVPA